MKRLFGIILFTAGLVGSFIFGLEVYENTESVKIFGSKFTLSQADWTPLIVSLGITVVGIILIASYQPKSRTKKRR